MRTGKTNTDIHRDLIDLCRNHDRSAQIKIYELYYKAMYNTSFRIVNNTMEAEDIMQDSFLDAFRKLDSFKGESSFGSWLKRIVINKSLDSLKKKKLFLSKDENELDIPELVEADEFDSITGRVQEVKLAMDNLADQYRIILSLYLLEGYDQQEIAEILGLSHNNVRVRYMRARQKLISEVNKTKNQFMDTLKN